jgi:hypothetical protein
MKKRKCEVDLEDYVCAMPVSSVRTASLIPFTATPLTTPSEKRRSSFSNVSSNSDLKVTDV